MSDYVTTWSARMRHISGPSDHTLCGANIDPSFSLVTQSRRLADMPLCKRCKRKAQDT